MPYAIFTAVLVVILGKPWIHSRMYMISKQRAPPTALKALEVWLLGYITCLACEEVPMNLLWYQDHLQLL